MHIARELAVAITLLLPCACDVESDAADRFAQIDAINAQSCNGSASQTLLELTMELGGLDQDATMVDAFDAVTQRQEESVAAMIGLELQVADAIEDGTYSADGFASQMDVLRATARVEGDAMTRALDTAYALLDPQTRREVVEALPEFPMMPAEPPSADELPPPPPEVAMLLDALELDEEQHAALRDALGEPMPPQHPPLPELETFADEGFEADAFGLVDATESMTIEHATRKLHLFTALVPLLEDAQRDALVKALREGPDESRQDLPD